MVGGVESTENKLLRNRKMSKKKPSAAEQVAINIRQATAKIIRDGIIPKYGVGFRIADIVREVRVIIGNTGLPIRDWLKAVAKWLDEKLVKYNNKYFTPTPKGYSAFLKEAAA